MGDLMLRWLSAARAGGDKMKLIHTHTISSAYTSTLDPLYTNEIKPYITFGDYSKLCVILFAGNTNSTSGKINCVFFSLAVDVQSATTDTTTGGMVRGNGYTNVRNLVLTNDAKCSAGTVIKIYTIDI